MLACAGRGGNGTAGDAGAVVDSVRDVASCPAGTPVRLVRDPRLDDVDRHRRRLRYVHAGESNVNVSLVREGAAAPYFSRSVPGCHATALLAAALEARATRRGLCRAAVRRQAARSRRAA